jgi:hypothetical protein
VSILTPSRSAASRAGSNIISNDRNPQLDLILIL